MLTSRILSAALVIAAAAAYILPGFIQEVTADDGPGCGNCRVHSRQMPTVGLRFTP
jgi:hypothetical protein